MFLGIYENKKVLVTGHTGFNGSWLSLWLRELGAEVIGYSLGLPTKPSLFEIIGLRNKIDAHIVGNIRDEQHLLSVFKKYEPEFVFHLAAQPLVRFSYKEPKVTYETNVMGTVNVLEAVRKTKSVKVCIIATSDKCYENKEWIYGYREVDAMGGYDPYSSSKGCAELVVASYRKSFFNPNDYGNTHNVALSSVRAGNMIGGGDWGENRLIVDCIKALSQNKTILIRNPEAIRPWEYVLEPTSGYLWLGALMYHEGIKFADAWNFGPNDSDILTVKQLVSLVIKQWGDGAYTIDTSSYPHEAQLLKLDVSKAHSLLRWKAIYNVYEAIEKTINWYKNFYSRNSTDLYSFTVRQIEEYIKKAKNKGLAWTQINLNSVNS
ncbi:MAG: CDP-glucose 4,6-dehydratase [Thermodesulfobacteriota bacterium]|nr:MAG: CDP-glucose 4,6-dehydratase [Thermodesulfobacteriota bacterium]